MQALWESAEGGRRDRAQDPLRARRENARVCSSLLSSPLRPLIGFIYSLIYLCSPHTNANLLQRTEVVALINTLHQFNESLAAVEEFRKLWREASAADTEKLIRDAEDAAKRVRFVLLYISHLDFLTVHAFMDALVPVATLVRIHLYLLC